MIQLELRVASYTEHLPDISLMADDTRHLVYTSTRFYMICWVLDGELLQGKPTSQISTRKSATSNYAVDGDINTCMHTLGESSYYYNINLETRGALLLEVGYNPRKKSRN